MRNEELRKSYTSPNIVRIIMSRRMGWVDHAARMRVERNAYGILVGNPEGKRPLGSPILRWNDNIKLTLKEKGWRSMDHINLAYFRNP
jgi:hypothetical protein